MQSAALPGEVSYGPGLIYHIRHCGSRLVEAIGATPPPGAGRAFADRMNPSIEPIKTHHEKHDIPTNQDVVCIGGHTRPGFTAKSARRAYAVQTAGADRVAAFMNWKNNNLPAEAAAVLGECRRSLWFTRLPNWSISPVAGPASQLRGRLRGAPAKRRVGITGPADYRMLPRWRKPQRLRASIRAEPNNCE